MSLTVCTSESSDESSLVASLKKLAFLSTDYGFTGMGAVAQLLDKGFGVVSANDFFEV